MDDLKHIGLAIIKARQNKGISQEDLAGSSDVARNYISRIENGHVSFSVVVLLKIAEALEVDPADLLP